MVIRGVSRAVRGSVVGVFGVREEQAGEQVAVGGRYLTKDAVDQGGQESGYRCTGK